MKNKVKITEVSKKKKTRVENNVRPVQSKNYGFYGVCLLIIAVGLFIWTPALYLSWLMGPMVLWVYYDTEFTIYTLYDDRLVETRGIFWKTQRHIEYPRVISTMVEEDPLSRVFGNITINVISSEMFCPELIIRGIPKDWGFYEDLCERVSDHRLGTNEIYLTR